MIMLSETQLAALPLPAQNMFKQLETDIITRICSRIGEIGALSETDVLKLNELQNIGYDIQAIQNEIAATLNKSTEEIYNIFSKAAEAEYASLGKTFIPFEQNAQLQVLVQSISNATAETFKNISKTSALQLLNRNGKFQIIETTYKQAVDYAALLVRTGQQDFYGAARQTIKNLSDGGASVMYESGVIRRLDTAVRTNILGAQAELSRQQAELTGKQFGADGWEISWHSGFRPTHTFGGLQFSKKDFENKEWGGTGKSVSELMEEPNCYHRKFPIILGVSEPAYSQEQLDKYNSAEKETHKFNGAEYNRYEATQRQRQYETAIRQQKDRANAFDAAGDKESATLARAKANAINQEYKRFSETMKIDTQPKRAAVSGYSGNYSKKLYQALTSRNKSSIISSGGGKL